MDLSTPPDHNISSGQGYAGAWPCSSDMRLSTPTKDSISIAMGTWGGSEDANTSPPTNGGYTNYRHTTETWANWDKGNSNAAPAPLSDFLKTWTGANEQSPSNSNSGPSRALSKKHREPAAALSASIPSPPPSIQATPTRPKRSLSDITSETQVKKRAVRRGPLTPQQRRDARCVRARGACFSCRELKQKV
jgi:hypothetical protein